MPVDINRTTVNVNGVPIPGLSRNGLFLSESPIDSYFLYRTPNLAANVAKTFVLDFTGIIEFIVANDTTGNAVYTVTIVTPENVTHTFTIPGAVITNYTGVRVIAFPKFPIDKGSRISIASSAAVGVVSIYLSAAIRLDTIDF